ncbi:L-lactate permease [Phytoactinopolyspora limicola]|uniref:L-lactate permease n=1 Tax=Phytoactinopolyspora limicola TaxID=2715536 RepID=UPI001A9C8F62|nr:L-lactate permease [Phytoactinopolyspora limicola]
MLTLVAALPILVVLVLMLAVRWSAARAGVVAALGTILFAGSVFEFGGQTQPYSFGQGVGGIVAEAGFVALTVIAIIGPALGIHHLQQYTGATDRLRAGLAQITPDPRLAALLIAWFFTLFLEGAAGFGTPVALAAPFLVAAGFRPLSAVCAAMIGHAAGVSFGAVGTPVLAQVAIVDVTGIELSRATAPYHVALGALLVGAVVVIVGRAGNGSPPWPWGALAAVLFFVPYGLIAWFVGPELPTLAGALVGAVGFVAVVSVVRRRDDGGTGAGTAPLDIGSMSLVRAGAPYLALVGTVLVTRMVPPIRDALVGVEVRWQIFDTFAGDVRPLYHPALLLTMAFVVGWWAQRAPGPDVRRAFGTATHQLRWVFVALVAMVTIAFTMSHSGMTTELADSAAATGRWWPLLAPAVGVLGTFVTGSATASNVLFTEFQQTTAQATGLPTIPMLGAQGFGAAVGNIICPHNIVAAAATVGLSGQEGRVLRVTMPVALTYAALGGVFASLFVTWW